MGVNSGPYKLVLVLHILCAIVGFGAVFLNGIYGAQARARRGPEGLAVVEANVLVSTIAEYFIYGVFVFGVLLVVLSDGVIEFGDTWVWLSTLLFVIALGLSHGLLQPNIRKIVEAMREMASGPAPDQSGPPPQLAVVAQSGRIVGTVGPALNLLMVLILFLMIWKPV